MELSKVVKRTQEQNELTINEINPEIIKKHIKTVHTF